MKKILKVIGIILGGIIVCLIPLVADFVKAYSFGQTHIHSNYDALPYLLVYVLILVFIKYYRGIKNAKKTITNLPKQKFKSPKEVAQENRERKDYIDSLDIEELKKESFSMTIENVVEVMGKIVVNGVVQSGVIEWKERKQGSSQIWDKVFMEIPLMDGSYHTVKVTDIAYAQDGINSTIIVKGDRASIGFYKDDCAKHGNIKIFGTVRIAS